MNQGQRTISVVISPIGKTKMEGHGFSGTECDAAMEPIEKALSGAAQVEKEYKESWATGDNAQQADLQQW